MINDEVLGCVTKIKILRELDLEQNLVFRSLLSNRIQEIILIPFVDKFRIIQVVFYLKLIYPTASGQTDLPLSQYKSEFVLYKSTVQVYCFEFHTRVPGIAKTTLLVD